MSTSEYAVCRHVVPILVHGERTHLVVAVGHGYEQILHPLRVGLKGIDSSKRIRLGRKCRLRAAVLPTCLPSLSSLTGIKELFSLLFDRTHGSAPFLKQYSPDGIHCLLRALCWGGPFSDHLLKLSIAIQQTRAESYDLQENV